MANLEHGTAGVPGASNVLRLVARPPDQGTIRQLETLLEGARSGEFTGLVLGVTAKDGSYITDVTGECSARPKFARGILAHRSDELAQLVHSRDFAHQR